MVRIEINNNEFFVKTGISVLEACEYVGIDIPRFCYHQDLSVAGNCRMCLVEIFNSPKPLAACALPILNNMKIYLDSPLVKKARENVLEALLLNHPLDCPICDQGGECDLQDQTKIYGIGNSRYFFKKRTVEDKNFNVFIKTIMTRCIHCTRCVRFNSEISGYDYLGTLNRGSSTEIGSYNSNTTYVSEISGNVIDLCPVGALTSKNYSFKSRPWELKTVESIDLSDNLGSNIYINYKESEILRVFPKTNNEINNTIISDKARYSFDYAFTNRIITTLSLNYLNQNQDVLCLVNNSSDLNTLFYLKNYENQLDFRFKAKSINLPQHKNNFYVNWLDSPLININQDAKICLLISTRLKIENAIINTKLRLKQIQSNIEIFGFATFFNENYNIQYVNLNLLSIYTILEGKHSEVSKLLIQHKNLLIIYGDSLFKRGLNKQCFINTFKKITFNCTLINIYNSCNLEGLNVLNYFPINSNDFYNSKTIIAINLEDSNLISRLLALPKLSNKILIWINTHQSELPKSFPGDLIIVPYTTEYEEEKIYLNLEQRIQKTSQVLRPISSKILSIEKIFDSLFINQHGGYNKHMLYLKEMLTNNSLFFNLSSSKVFNWEVLKSFLLNLKKSISLYPIKHIITDFFLSNKNLKSSKTMQIASQKIRKINSWF